MKIQLTTEGHKELKAELEELTTIKRPAAVLRLSKARSMGDLAENSEYHAAKEELAFADGRVREVEAILKQAEVVETNKSSTVVALGSKVELKSVDGKEMYDIVGEFEANPIEKKLSSTSPLGQALMGRNVGETIEVTAPAGKKTYTVVAIN